MSTDQNQNRIEKLSSNEALRLIFSTTNTPSVEHPRINPERVDELSKSLGRWKRPKIVTTPRGVVLEGLDHLAALASSGKSVEVEIDRTGKGTRRSRARFEPVSLASQLERMGVTNAAFKLAVWRGVCEAVENNPKEGSTKETATALTNPKFVQAFDALYKVYDGVRDVQGGKATRVRSKIAFAAFALAYQSHPKRVAGLYAEFLSGKVEEGKPIEKLLHAVRTDNINTGSGRRPFMLKAAVLLAAQLSGEKVERAVADEEEGSKVVQIFRGQLGGNA